MPAGCGGEHGQANSHWIQPHLPHHHSRGWARRHHQPKTVPQPPKKAQGKTPSGHQPVFTMSCIHITTLLIHSVTYFIHSRRQVLFRIKLSYWERNVSSINCPRSELMTCFFSCDVITFIPPGTSENQTAHRDTIMIKVHFCNLCCGYYLMHVK